MAWWIKLSHVDADQNIQGSPAFCSGVKVGKRAEREGRDVEKGPQVQAGFVTHRNQIDPNMERAGVTPVLPTELTVPWAFSRCLHYLCHQPTSELTLLLGCDMQHCHWRHGKVLLVGKI